MNPRISKKVHSCLDFQESLKKPPTKASCKHYALPKTQETENLNKAVKSLSKTFLEKLTKIKEHKIEGLKKDLTKENSTSEKKAILKMKPRKRSNRHKLTPKLLDEIKLVSSMSGDDVQYLKKRISLGACTKAKTIIFDLDETLIKCTHNTDSTNSTEKKKKKKDSDCKGRVLNFQIRPYCLNMIKKLSSFYELILFTASKKKYADAVLNVIDPQRQYFKHRLYRDSCVNKQGFLVKDLRIFKDRSLSQIVLVDNSIISFAFQINNGVPIQNYEGQKDDKVLIGLTNYLYSIKDVNDLRNSNKQIFGIQNRIQEMRDIYEDEE